MKTFKSHRLIEALDDYRGIVKFTKNWLVDILADESGEDDYEPDVQVDYEQHGMDITLYIDGDVKGKITLPVYLHGKYEDDPDERDILDIEKELSYELQDLIRSKKKK